MPLAEFQTVRIKVLLREGDAYDPHGDNDRSPRVGDTGAIVDVRQQTAGQTEYTVECCRPDGTCVWIADFEEQELEAVEPEAPRPRDEVESQSERVSDPPSSGEADPTADEPRGPGWRRYLVPGIVALLVCALAVAVIVTWFLRWPPDSAVGAGLRTATVVVVFFAAGALVVGEKLGDLLVTAIIVAVTFFALGAVGWTVAFG